MDWRILVFYSEPEY